MRKEQLPRRKFQVSSRMHSGLPTPTELSLRGWKIIRVVEVSISIGKPLAHKRKFLKMNDVDGTCQEKLWKLTDVMFLSSCKGFK